MASLEQFRKIATYCTQYKQNIDSAGNLESSSRLNQTSCTNCTHFKDNKSCELNLIDKVLSSLSMDTELKN